MTPAERREMERAARSAIRTLPDLALDHLDRWLSSKRWDDWQSDLFRTEKQVREERANLRALQRRNDFLRRQGAVLKNALVSADPTRIRRALRHTDLRAVVGWKGKKQ